MNDLVRGGFAQAGPEPTETQFVQYGTGRKFRPAATNYALSPSCEIESGTAGLAANFAVFKTSAAYPTYTLVPGRDGGLAQRMVHTSAADSNKQTYLATYSAAGTFSPGDPVAGSFYIKGSASGVVVQCVTVGLTDVLGVITTGPAQTITLTGEWQRVSSLIASCGATVGRAGVRCKIDAIDAGDTFDITVDDFQVEKAAAITDYLDGGQTFRAMPDAAWASTVNASASTRAATSVAVADYVTVTSAGAVAAGTKVAYARNGAAGYYGPVVVTDAAKSADWQAAAALLWSDPTALFGICSSGDLVIPMDGDSVSYLRVDGAISPFDLRDNLVVFEGDSLVAGNHNVAGELFTEIVAASFDQSVWSFVNVGAGSDTAQAMIAEAAAQVTPKYDPAYTHNVAHIWAGANDIAGGRSAAQIEADLWTWCDARKATGFEVVVGTVIANGSFDATEETARTDLNTALRANYAAHADRVSDYAADAHFDAPADVTDRAIYQADSAHLTKAGNVIAAGIFQTAVESLP